MSGTPKKTSSSPYQILGNRPIDQWKVTELKEELKRRRLTTKGLKDDLVKRLDEALRIEKDSAREKAEASLNGAADADAQVQDKDDGATTPEKAMGGSDKDFETPQKIEDREIERTDDDWVEVNAVDRLPVAGEQNKEVALVSGMVSVEETITVVQNTVVETTTETVVSETSLSVQETENESVMSEAENDKMKSRIENEVSKSEIGTEDSEGSRHQNDSEKPVQVDSTGYNQDLGSKGKDGGTIKSIVKDDHVPISEQEDAPFPTNQVSEASPVPGLVVKSDSISSDSVSIVEKNELEDNIIADNVKFELNVKPEMVKPSSMNVAPDAGGSHPIDIEDSLEKKLSSNEKDGNATKGSADAEYPEKLNLDRSSGDDSMDEDVFDNKQMDTKNVSNVYEDKNEQNAVEIKDEIVVDVVSEGKEDSHVNGRGVAAAEKRKLPGQQSAGNNEPVKRQRRWNAESVKVTEPQITAANVSTTPKESISAAVEKSNFFRSDSLNSEETTKDRVVPPSANPATNSLRIDRFLRPFTLKAVQELLGKTGKVVSFWMDHIKTHCYVTYSSVEEAIETRNAVYNLQWPTNGGRLLVADFVDPQEVKNRVEAPTPSPAAPVSTPTPQAAAPTKQPQSSPRQVQRLQPPVPTSFPTPPQLSVPPPARELPPTSLPEKLDPPIVTLDDLFRKTTTLPRIYYLPLSEEQVADKVAARGKNIKA